MTHSLVLPRSALTHMRNHVRRRAPLEACGLLAGRHDQVELVLGVRNAARSPVRYLMDPRQQWHAFEKFERLGMDLLGIYHSHPQGPAHPSSTDVGEAMYPVVQVIWWRQGEAWLAGGFWIEAGQVSTVQLEIRS